MAELRVRTAPKPLSGSFRVPGDKSISHRAAILGTLASGRTRIENMLQSDTTRATVDCLCSLGARVEGSGTNAVVIEGRGLHGLSEPRDILFCKGSGTTMRLMAGVCAGQDFLSVLDGTAELKRRPMARVVEPLRQMGATVLGRDQGRLPPLAIRGGRLGGVQHTLPVASAQVKSALLLAGLFADSPTVVREPSLSRDHTERMLVAAGVPVEVDRAKALVQVTPASAIRLPDTVTIPGDFSSAAFLIVAALLVPGSCLRVEGVGVNPTRTGLLQVLGNMGARIEVENEREESGEPVGDLVVQAGHGLAASSVSGELVPRLIDEFPILAVAAACAHGETVVRGAAELRVKESDRIGMLVQEMRKLGVEIEPSADGFTIRGSARLQGARVSSHRDHRLAMSLAVAGLVASGETVVEEWECVSDSFPSFERWLLPWSGG